MATAVPKWSAASEALPSRRRAAPTEYSDAACAFDSRRSMRARNTSNDNSRPMSAMTPRSVATKIDAFAARTGPDGRAASAIRRPLPLRQLVHAVDAIGLENVRQRNHAQERADVG